MDDWELAICEKIFDVIKEEDNLPDVILKQMVLNKEEWNDPKKIKKVNRLVEILDQHGIVQKRSANNGYKVHVGSNALIFDSFQNYLADFKEKQKESEEEKSLNKEKLNLEIENLQLQIIHQKQWFWKVIAGAIAIELIQFYFLFFK